MYTPFSSSIHLLKDHLFIFVHSFVRGATSSFSLFSVVPRYPNSFGLSALHMSPDRNHSGSLLGSWSAPGMLLSSFHPEGAVVARMFSFSTEWCRLRRGADVGKTFSYLSQCSCSNSCAHWWYCNFLTRSRILMKVFWSR